MSFFKVYATQERHEFENILDEFGGDNRNANDPSVVIDQYECFVGVLKIESEVNGLIDLWELSKSLFESNIGRWRRCGSSSSPTGVL